MIALYLVSSKPKFVLYLFSLGRGNIGGVWYGITKIRGGGKTIFIHWGRLSPEIRFITENKIAFWQKLLLQIRFNRIKITQNRGTYLSRKEVYLPFINRTFSSTIHSRITKNIEYQNSHFLFLFWNKLYDKFNMHLHI